MARHTSPVATGAGDNGVDSHRGDWIDDMPGGWEPKETAAAPGQLREEQVRPEEDYAHRMVPLRNGAGEMTLIKASEAEVDLRDLLRDEPALFQALRALAEGRREEVSREQVKALRKEGFAMGSGRVRGDLQLVLKASYEEKDGQPSIVPPFDMTNPNDAAAVMKLRDWEERVERRTDAFLERRRQERNQGQGRG